MEKKGQSRSGSELRRERKVTRNLREAHQKIELSQTRGAHKTRSQGARASAIQAILNATTPTE